MNDASIQNDNLKFRFESSHRNIGLVLTLIGIAALIAGFFIQPQRVWISLLIDGYYFVSLSLLAVFFIAILNLTGARWAEAIRRIPEAMTTFLPFAGLALMTILLGLPKLYHWSHADVMAHDHLLQLKAPFLNQTFFALRMVIILTIWSLFAWRLRTNSRRQDAEGGLARLKRNTAISAGFIVVLAPTLSLASFDWIMSIDPHWFSTIFGVYNFAGAFVSALVTMTLIVLFLKDRGYLKGVNDNHLHDLGKLIFAFSMFWAYLWFCQFMLIWYGNITEETIYYVERLKAQWGWLFLGNFVANFVVPFFVLLPRSSKRNTTLLKCVCLFLLVTHWFDLYVMIVPGVMGASFKIGPLEAFLALGYVGAFILVIGRALEKASLMPLKAPFLAESLHYHQ